MANVPSISLLIPCFNASSRLPRLLEAAQNQTVPFQEILCYDDGSDDDTAEVAEKWGARVIRGGKNRGVGVARGRLLEAATTDWVHFHDADDLLSPNYVEVMSGHASQLQPQTSQNTVLICGMTSIPTEEYVQKQRAAGAYKDAEPKAKTFCELNNTNDQVTFLLDNFVHLNTALFPAKALREVGGFCPYLRISEDVDMMVRLAAHKVKFRAFSDVLVTRVNYKESLIKSTKKAQHYRYTLHYVNRCFKRLPPQYRPILGEKALFYARYFYWEGLLVDARRALRLAKRCGVQVSQRAPIHHRLLVKLIGPEKLFWLLKRRSKMGS